LQQHRKQEQGKQHGKQEQGKQGQEQEQLGFTLVLAKGTAATIRIRSKVSILTNYKP
jgi:hypothetical protein